MHCETDPYTIVKVYRHSVKLKSKHNRFYIRNKSHIKKFLHTDHDSAEEHEPQDSVDVTYPHLHMRLSVIQGEEPDAIGV